MVKSKIIFSLLWLGSSYAIAQDKVTDLFPQKWQTKIGVSTYRTNMLFHQGSVFIGSNGLDRNQKVDDLDGVYQLNAKTGAIEHHFKCPLLGDNDVNGIAIGDNKLFFGSDNHYFFCFDLKSKKELWKTNVPNDVESCPQLADLNGDQILDVGFPVEGDAFYALDGKSGGVLWSNGSISCHSGNVSPLIYDVNQDGTMDFISSGRGTPNSNETAGFKMQHYGDYHLALNGKDGSYLWLVETGAGVHASPNFYSHKNKTELLFLDAYGEFLHVDMQGKILTRVGFGYDNFSSPLVTKDEYLIIGGGSLEFNSNAITCDDSGKPCFVKEEAVYTGTKAEGRISASTMLADVLNKKKDQLIGVTESGTLFISETNGKPIRLLALPAGAEASVFIKDIDGDGKLEILIADLAGNLTCYDTNSRAKASHGAFR